MSKFFCNTFNCRPNRMSCYWIISNTFAMAQYGEVSQLLALMQWGARAQTCVTIATMELRLLPCSHWVTPGPDSWLSSGWPRLLTDWLWTWLKLAITRWPTWAVLVRHWLQVHYQCGASTWTWLGEVSSCRGNLSSRGQPTSIAQVTWYQRNWWYHWAMISDNLDIIGTYHTIS